MANDNDNLRDDYTLKDVTLESILAEYKGTAYINGDKKTPSELLNAQTDWILKEAFSETGDMGRFELSDDLLYRTGEGQGAPPSQGYDPARQAVPQQENYPQAQQETYAAQPQPEIYAAQPQPEYHPQTQPEIYAAQPQPEYYPQPQLEEYTTPQPEYYPQTQPEEYTAPQPEYYPQAQPEEYTAPQPEYYPQAQPEEYTAPQPEYYPQTQPEEYTTPQPEYYPQTQPEEYTALQPEYYPQPIFTQPVTPPPPDDRDNVILFFDNYNKQDAVPQDALIRDVEKAVEREIGYEEIPSGAARGGFAPVGQPVLSEEGYTGTFEEYPEEPDLKDAARRIAGRAGSTALRSIPAAIVTLIMVILTLASEAGLKVPFGIGYNLIYATGTLMIMLLIVMILGVDIIVRGARDLIRGAPNVETLILFSCAFSYISGAFTMLQGGVGILPYCAVSAVSLTLAALGEGITLRAALNTLKAAAGSAEPYGVQAEYNGEINKSVLKKAYNRIDGFYNNLMHPDISESAYRYASPVLLVAALVFSIITALVKGRGEYFLHIMSALLAAAAPFSATLAFSIPFGTVVKSIRKSGAAIAGWGGADDICFTDGACVTDDDLFPPGTLSFSGVKMYEKVDPEKAIRYTASLIIASGSGLARIFSEVLQSQKMDVIRIEDFACYEGGIGARIHGDHVMTGSGAFMHLLGIRIPDDMNLKNAVFTSVNSKLIAVFAVDYLPINSVQGALISMLKWRIKLFFAMRDFNVTPLMLEQKFRVSLEDIEYIQAKDSYSISDSYSGRQGRMSAILTREGLGPFAEAVTGGRLLKTAALIATAVSVISAAFGVLFMFYMCWNGAFMSAKPGNLLWFMLSALAAVLVVCGYVKCRK